MSLKNNANTKKSERNVNLKRQQTISRKSPLVSMDDDEVTKTFLACKVNQDLTTDEHRKVIQSVELTKALVLMGFPTWSTLEPGKY
mgnify:CR=1 FL=1